MSGVLWAAGYTLAIMLAALAVLVGVPYGAYRLFKAIRDAKRAAARRTASASLGLALDGCAIARRGDGHAVPSFTLATPVWSSAKKDGTRDQRTNDTAVKKPPSVIAIRGWTISYDDPFLAYADALRMRAAGMEVPPCAQEVEYARETRKLAEKSAGMKTAKDLVRAFKKTPTDFEKWFAELVNDLGGFAETTPPSRDGGYDVSGVFPDGATFAAECKLFAPKRLVGRPIVQKLVGANAALGMEVVAVVTTGGFSDDAREYAESVGAYLVDGAQLSELIRMRDDAPEPSVRGVMPAREIMELLPEDMRPRYRGSLEKTEAVANAASCGGAYSRSSRMEASFAERSE